MIGYPCPCCGATILDATLLATAYGAAADAIADTAMAGTTAHDSRIAPYTGERRAMYQVAYETALGAARQGAGIHDATTLAEEALRLILAPEVIA